MVIIWKFNLPLKVICFVWLCLANRINSWDNLQKKGWIGPSYCCLCLGDAESVDHIFVDCSFTKEVIGGLSVALQRNISWNEPTFKQSLVKWTGMEKKLKYLPLLMTWQLWITCNRIIFENYRSCAQLTIHIILDQLHRYEVKVAARTNRRLFGMEPVYEYPVGFFDGASANRIGGVGVHIILSNEHYFHFKLGCSLSTNTQSELLALWILLVFAKLIGLPYLHLKGDSSTNHKLV